VVLAPKHVAQSMNAADLPPGCSLAGVLEFAGRTVEERDEDGGARGLARTADLMAGASAHAARIVGLRGEDLLVLMQPSLSEFWSGPTLRARPPRLSDGGKTHVRRRRRAALPDDSQRAHWRLAVSELGDATDGRLAIVTVSPTDAAKLRTWLDRPVHAIGQPTPAVLAPNVRLRPRVVCLGTSACRARATCSTPSRSSRNRRVPSARLVSPSAGARTRVMVPPGPTIRGRSTWRPCSDSICSISHTAIAMRDEIADADAIVIVGDGSKPGACGAPARGTLPACRCCSV
jgi:hypothetical protein